MGEREKLLKKYSSARTNLLMMLILTGVNLILIAVNASISFPFSAAMPQVAYAIGSTFAEESGSSAFFIIGLVIALISIAMYLPCYFLSKKRYGWLIGALVLFIMDTLLLILFMVTLGDFTSSLIDVAFHAWVLYYLITGVSSGSRLSHMSVVEKSVSETDSGINA